MPTLRRPLLVWLGLMFAATGLWLQFGDGSAWRLLLILAGATLVVRAFARSRPQPVAQRAPVPAAVTCRPPRTIAPRTGRSRPDMHCRASRRPRHGRVHRRARS